LISGQVPPYPRGHDLLDHKTVLVTAAAGTGIGFATARRCAEEGATVTLSDKHEARLARCAALLEEETGKKVPFIVCDVTDEARVQAMFEYAISEMGHIDVLVNNAGLGGTANLVDMSDEQWSAVLDVTLNGSFRCVRAAMRHMLPRGRARSSISAALSPGAPRPARPTTRRPRPACWR
jgi:3-oxoacyl-[acyl-carrier protein] reductase